MIGTVEEAKKWWCPMARSASGFGASGSISTEPTQNRDFEGDPARGCHCIAAKCAAWRWLPKPVDTRSRSLYSKRIGQKVTAAYGDDGEWRLDNPDEPEPTRKGYCGAFGKPEAE